MPRAYTYHITLNLPGESAITLPTTTSTKAVADSINRQLKTPFISHHTVSNLTNRRQVVSKSRYGFIHIDKKEATPPDPSKTHLSSILLNRCI